MTKSQNEIIDKIRNTSSYILQKPKTVILSIFLSITIFVFSIICSQIIKTIFNEITLDKNFSDLEFLSLFFIWIVFTKSLFNYTNNFIKNKIETTIFKNINSIMVNKLFNGKVSQIEKLSKGDIFARFQIIHAVSSYQSLIFCSLYSQAFCFVACFSYLFYLNKNITFIVVFSVIVIFLVSLASNYYYSKKYEQILKNSENFNLSIINIVNNFKTNRLGGLKNFWHSKFQQENITIFDQQNNIFEKISIFEEIINFMLQLSPILIIYLSLHKTEQSNFQIGDIMLFTTFFNYLIPPTKNISYIISNYSNYTKNINKLNYFFEIENENINQPFNQISDIKKIKIKDFSFGYVPSKILLKIRDLEIDKKIIIEGKNGIGKSTFLKIFTNLYDYNGSVQLNNIELKNFNIEELRYKVNYVSNEVNLFEGSVFENICFRDDYFASIFKNNYEYLHLEDVLKYFNLSLTDKISANGQNLSSGQKQLVNILKNFFFTKCINYFWRSFWKFWFNCIWKNKKYY
ncbi:ATP-binding cassette domain-containing protein [[Mycoplasma] gypis]|uniref:ATP-binding cassette domain-containing protein n=1 Tax=[Mycoplasma] gypis TaxID=92404 RepID=UPI00196760BB|nr:ABC transporter ATP-binding protein [[Mycoplasma] gypis]MBN0919132.1 ABC transporter ATP-binding protein [[Mycoplasma] gypis]